MSAAITKFWLWLSDRAASRGRRSVGGLVAPPSASAAPLRALVEWRPDWKTEVIAAVLGARQGTLIDVGANVGQTLLDFCAAPRRSTYLGFEPNAVCVQHLATLVQANDLQQSTIVPAALGDRTGIGTLHSYGGAVDSGATTRTDLRPRLRSYPSRICVYRLDDIEEILPEAEIALIKIDVEGSELEVLHGMQQVIAARQPWILCEVLHRDSSADVEPFSRRCAEFTQLVHAMHYDVLRILQSSDGTSVAGLEAVDAFPDREWDDATSPRECEYLFVPKGQSQTAHELLSP